MKKVLLIDNDKDYINLLANVFAKRGHSFLTADNASDGIAIYKANLSDVVLIEINLPKLNNAVREILAIDKDIVIVFVSKAISCKELIEGISLGIRWFIIKNYENCDILIERIRTALIEKQVLPHKYVYKKYLNQYEIDSILTHCLIANVFDLYEPIEYTADGFHMEKSFYVVPEEGIDKNPI